MENWGFARDIGATKPSILVDLVLDASYDLLSDVKHGKLRIDLDVEKVDLEEADYSQLEEIFQKCSKAVTKDGFEYCLIEEKSQILKALGFSYATSEPENVFKELMERLDKSLDSLRAKIHEFGI